MDKYQRICELTGLSVNDVRLYLARIVSLEVEPEDVRQMLNAPDVKDGEKRGRSDIIRGLIVIVGALLGALATTAVAPAVSTFLMVVALGGTVFVYLGVRRMEPVWAAKKQAENLREELEGPDGLLWRFQGLLEHKDADGPVKIYESLKAACEQSRGGVRGLSPLELLTYWHWVTMTHAHLGLAEQGIEDPSLDPYDSNE